MFDSFPQENRRDAELVSFFEEQGVPPSQIVYLKDREATALRAPRAQSIRGRRISARPRAT